MSQNIISFSSRGLDETPRQATTSLLVGRKYRFAWRSERAPRIPAGMVGGYQPGPEAALIFPALLSDGTISGYFFDSQEALSEDWLLEDSEAARHRPEHGYRIALNPLNLVTAELFGPALAREGEDTRLMLEPTFHLRFETDAGAARLGVVNLVQSQRFLQLESGEQITLVDEPEPVLYLEPGAAAGNEAVHLLTPGQQQGLAENYCYQVTVDQPIPTLLDGMAVASVTVLEHYHTYFMQRECSAQSPATIWIPAHAPISWGWSIRVARRPDHEWGIVRRKLLRPTVGHEGLEFPVWQANYAPR